MRVFDLAATTPWALTASSLQTILKISAREDLDPAAVAAELGRPLDNTRTTSERSGVAIIPIDGPIFRHANMFTEISGATSIEVLAKDFHKALTNSAISAIVLNIDSPGGEVNGTNEFANMVFAARGTKPIIAYISDLGASAAYWIASAADEIVVADTALVGSIGIVAAVPDPSKQYTRDIEIVSSKSPKKRANPNDDAGRQQIQDTIDALADVFISTVARNRGVTPDKVVADFGKGDVLVGAAAVKAGLADRVGSFEAVISELSERDPRTPWTSPRSARAAVARRTGAATGSRRQEKTMPTVRQFLAEMFTPKGEREGARAADDEPSILDADIDSLQLQAARPVFTPDDAPKPAPPAAQSEEFKRLQASLDEERNARITTQATAFAEAEIAAGRAFPAEREHIEALYSACAKDDASHPWATQANAAEGTPMSRVALLRVSYGARKAHDLTTEQIEADVDKALLPQREKAVLPNKLGSDDSTEIGDKAEQGARAYAQRMNGPQK